MQKIKWLHLVILSFFILKCTFVFAKNEQNQSSLKFEITFPKSAHSQNITGRVFVMISKTDDREPRLKVSYTGVPIWGKDINNLKPGVPITIDDSIPGYILESIKDIPPGTYYLQGFVNIYTEFKRSDGKTLWLHNDQWEGQKWNRSPGNLHSDVQKITIDPNNPQTIRLECKNVIPPVQIPEDTEWVKRIKIKSEILTKFWGQPIYLGATILLPKGYETHSDVDYPVHYQQGHFSLRAPHRFRPDTPFYNYWNSDDCPRIVTITFQHPCPYYDDSYGVNSPNTGPYGDAIFEELIPHLEEHFRIIKEPYGRVLSGGSTGGWISLALQVFHPDFFGGTWPLAPDPVDFRWYEIFNIYEDNNAFYKEYEWLKVPRPGMRDTNGQIQRTIPNTYNFERIIGPKHRSGAQRAIWEAVFSPIGEDGYPQPLMDWETGVINHEVAEQWKKYDLRHYMEKNWSWLGPKLKGKIHVYVGDMDNYYLNLAVVLLEEFLENTKNPYYDGEVVYGDGERHVWGPGGKELYEIFEKYITKIAPKNADTSKWKY
jgi:hypothetical protein